MLNLVFLWHMHQPSYKDPINREYILPWVRLHAVKGYYDMIRVIEEFNEAHAVFNLTPSLVKQVQDYASHQSYDAFHELSTRPAEDLSPPERIFIIRNFFMCNWDTMVRPHSEYFRLLNKRGTRAGLDLHQIEKRFTDQEIRDLQVWYNLCWFGFKARDDIPELEELIRKGHDFTEEEKVLVISAQEKILKKLLDCYRRNSASGQVELSTTPFYHPILPLIYDSHLALRANPRVKVPRFSHPEDARAQVDMAVAYHEKIFGQKPAGMWPSEGAVAPELIPIWAEAGIEWVATDEDILLEGFPARKRPEDLLKPYLAEFDGRQVAMVFRDRILSDLIGFTYSRNPAEVAVSDFLRHLEAARRSARRAGIEHPLCAVILDGENPWEYYPESGRDFLRTLYSRLIEEPNFNLTTFKDYLADHPAREFLPRFNTGSWINHNFNIWIGQPEENKAWEYLEQVRNDLERLSAHAPPDKARAAWDEFYAAQGSDWFWWYGDDFSTDTDAEYDQLFRTHLRNSYRILNERPALFLDEPVIFDHPVRLTEEPMGLISPVIDGRVTNFYEWHEAGCLDLCKIQGAMYQSLAFFEKFYFGFDLDHLYLRFDPTEPEADEPDLHVRVRFLHPLEQVLFFPLRVSTDQPQRFTHHILTEEGQFSLGHELTSIRAERIIELAISFEDLNLKANDEVALVVELVERDIERARYPRDGYISFAVPDENFEIRMWSV